MKERYAEIARKFAVPGGCVCGHAKATHIGYKVRCEECPCLKFEEKS